MRASSRAKATPSRPISGSKGVPTDHGYLTGETGSDELQAGPGEERMRKSERLSPMDSMMLFFETSTGSGNIFGVCHTEGRISFDDFVCDFRHRLHRLPLFRKIIVPVPFDLAHPTWEGDPSFDLHEHLHHVELESPGSEEQLRELASEVSDVRFDCEQVFDFSYTLNRVRRTTTYVVMTSTQGSVVALARFDGAIDCRSVPAGPSAGHSAPCSGLVLSVVCASKGSISSRLTKRFSTSTRLRSPRTSGHTSSSPSSSLSPADKRYGRAFEGCAPAVSDS